MFDVNNQNQNNSYHALKHTHEALWCAYICKQI